MLLSLLPFCYFARTRIEGLRDLAYLVATSWIPGIWLLIRLGGLGPVEALTVFGIGYLAFIAVYEIGYLVNDGWDAKKTPDGRNRLPFALNAAFVGAFVLIRVAAWIAVGAATGWLESGAWLGCFATLAVVFAAHNLISSAALRAASFYQLATLRFVAPVIAALPREDILPAVTAALLFYTYFRFLSYLESKALLDMPDRREAHFSIAQVAILAPLILFLAFTTGSLLMAELLLYFALLYGAWALGLRIKPRRQDAAPGRPHPHSRRG
jgi:hypothetical protein